MQEHGAWSDSRDVLLSFPISVEAIDRSDAEGAAML